MVFNDAMSTKTSEQSSNKIPSAVHKNGKGDRQVRSLWSNAPQEIVIIARVFEKKNNIEKLSPAKSDGPNMQKHNHKAIELQAFQRSTLLVCGVLVGGGRWSVRVD